MTTQPHSWPPWYYIITLELHLFNHTPRFIPLLHTIPSQPILPPVHDPPSAKVTSRKHISTTTIFPFPDHNVEIATDTVLECDGDYYSDSERARNRVSSSPSDYSYEKPLYESKSESDSLQHLSHSSDPYQTSELLDYLQHPLCNRPPLPPPFHRNPYRYRNLAHSHPPLQPPKFYNYGAILNNSNRNTIFEDPDEIVYCPVYPLNRPPPVPRNRNREYPHPFRYL
ncbi:hypothetical protein BOTCAL_0683g00020 [Botryotinia calthae]|uniref:Uncharacterized protein n=1 Tax=Botryotinia calthae TaxID=38488 RepID=A0A4Y8CJW5_9HELO|nr:hypothetical protein BOTCAL_0683g00020 [Botryotinia calthae]